MSRCGCAERNMNPKMACLKRRKLDRGPTDDPSEPGDSSAAGLLPKCRHVATTVALVELQINISSSCTDRT